MRRHFFAKGQAVAEYSFVGSLLALTLLGALTFVGYWFVTSGDYLHDLMLNGNTLKAQARKNATPPPTASGTNDLEGFYEALGMSPGDLTAAALTVAPAELSGGKGDTGVDTTSGPFAESLSPEKVSAEDTSDYYEGRLISLAAQADILARRQTDQLKLDAKKVLSASGDLGLAVTNLQVISTQNERLQNNWLLLKKDMTTVSEELANEKGPKIAEQVNTINATNVKFVSIYINELSKQLNNKSASLTFENAAAIFRSLEAVIKSTQAQLALRQVDISTKAKSDEEKALKYAYKVALDRSRDNLARALGRASGQPVSPAFTTKDLLAALSKPPIVPTVPGPANDKGGFARTEEVPPPATSTPPVASTPAAASDLTTAPAETAAAADAIRAIAAADSSTTAPASTTP